MAGADLDALGGRIEAGLPLHDAVGPRVDRDEADAGWVSRFEVVPEGLAAVAPEARAPHEALEAQRADRAHPDHRRVHERVDSERVFERRAERDDSRHEVRPP